MRSGTRTGALLTDLFENHGNSVAVLRFEYRTHALNAVVYGVRPRKTFTLEDQLDAVPGSKSKIEDGSRERTW